DPAPILAQKPLCTRFNTTSLYVSHVCSQWRSLSFSTSEMWSWMIISSPDESCLKLVEYYLHRAGGIQGLNLSLSEFNRVGTRTTWVPRATEESKWTLAIFNLWIPEVHRWKSICFNISTGPRSKLLNLSPSSLSGITSASLQLYWLEPTALQFWDNLHTSPALKEVIWPRGFNLIPSSAPLAQLTSVHLLHEFISWTEFFKLLSSCPRLRWVRAMVIPITPAEAVSMTMTVAHCLETLLLPLTPSEVGSGILLDFIEAPNLRVLQMDASQSDSAVLGRFLCRSKCQLRKLSLKTQFYGSYSEADLIDNLIHAAPHLTSLEMCELSYNGLSSLTLSAFSPQLVNGAISILLPSIVRLSLFRVGPTPDGALGNMLLSRAEHDTLPWLFEASFMHGNEIHTRDKEIISQLQERGLHARLSSG
ncbi:hypothetical protein BDN72DRAFT_843289, partial [Pluteus cervinus]